MPEHENKSPDPPGPSPTTKTSRKLKKNHLPGSKIDLRARKIDSEHENSTPEHEKSIPEHENGSPEPPAPSPTTKNPENGPKTPKNPKNRKFEVGGTRPEAYINIIFIFCSSAASWPPGRAPTVPRIKKQTCHWKARIKLSVSS